VNLKEYYKSKHWIKLSSSILENKECECAVCHRKRWKWQPRKKKWKRVLRFNVHHLHYRYLNEEENHPECLLPLCSLCHSICHDAFRYKNVSPMYTEIFEIVKKYGFNYIKEEGGTTE